jgi:2-polyprenyl-6-methoxyphenol hydroxylase-like FAD-dependent oxidoreductase
LSNLINTLLNFSPLPLFLYLLLSLPLLTAIFFEYIVIFHVMASKSHKNIAIIGGSLGGLFTGSILKSQGHTVTILERTPSSNLKDQGAGISIGPVVPPIFSAIRKHTSDPSGAPMVEFFNKYDTKKRQVCEYVPKGKDGIQFLNIAGEKKISMKLPMVLGSTSWEVLYTVLRGVFDRDEEGRNENARYLDGAKVDVIEEVGAKMEVKFVDKTGENHILEVDLVIGADGPNSFVRKIFSPEDERTYAGYVAWRGVVPEGLVDENTSRLLANASSFFYRKENQVVM